MKRTPMMDEKTGEYNLKYNMQNMLEDFYIPVRGNDNATKIDTTPGLSYDGIQDVEYLRDKLFAALKIPKAFLGYDENTEGKATLAAEDIRFARTIDRIQRIILSEFNKIALVHLYTQGYTDETLTNFELSMTTRGKQENNFGKDPLGVKRMKDTDKNDGDGRPSLSESESAHVTYLKNKDIFRSLNKKKLIFEEDENTSSLLDESQLKS